MNYLGVHIAPDLVEESWRELERQRELGRAIRERRNAQRAARRAARISRFAAHATRLRRVGRLAPRGPVTAGC